MPKVQPEGPSGPGALQGLREKGGPGRLSQEGREAQGRKMHRLRQAASLERAQEEVPHLPGGLGGEGAPAVLAEAR